MESFRKISASATAAVFFVLIFGLGIAFWLCPDAAISPAENRALQTRPVLTAEGWVEGRVSAELTAYYADQFPLRPLWMGLHAMGELAMGRGESNGVLVGREGQLAVRRHDVYVSRTARAEDTDIFRPAHIAAGLEALVRLDKTLSAEGIPLTVLLPPRVVDVATTGVSYPSALSDALDATIRERLAEVDSIDLLSDLRARYAAGEYIYFRTDHHWTQRGAYVAYAAVMASFGADADICPPDFFSIRAVPDFYGTSHARAGLCSVPPDTLEIFEATDGSDARYTVRNERGETVIPSGFISEKHLTGRDKYGAFLDGTHRILTVTDTATDDTRPRLLLAKDSFGAAMVPFLARHFDIVSVNLTGGQTDLSALARQYGCDRVLVVCNRENLITSDCLLGVR